MSARKTKKPRTQESSTFLVRHRKLFIWAGGILTTILILILAVFIAFRISPWPNSLLIRYEFNKNSAKVSAALQKYVPGDITQVENQQYRQGDDDAYLDIFYPAQTDKPRPTIVWVHGGGWVSGDKDDVDNYMKILAGRGFTTISVNYSIAPEKQYPTPIIQLNDALEYVQHNTARLNIDDSHLVLAGDSAGSQIVAQEANIITSPAYANEIGISPKLSPAKLKGLLLNCGAYDLASPDYNGPFGSFLHTVLWAYSGTKDFLHDPKLKTASVVNYLTPQFPPSFTTAGNVDPLLSQSTELAKKLQTLGVTTSTLFYPADHQPALNHEYQFDLDTTDAKNAFEQMVDFAHQRMQ